MGHWITSTYIPWEGRTWFENPDDKDNLKVRKTECLVEEDRLAHTAFKKEPFLKEEQTAKGPQYMPLLSPVRRLKRQFIANLVKLAQITPQIAPQPGFPTTAGALWVTHVIAESDIHPRSSHSQLFFPHRWHGFEMSWKLWVYEPIQQKWLTSRSWGLGRLYLIAIAVSAS